MEYPNYYDEVKHIILKDDLSRFLGSSEEGIIDISYLDIVKMAGDDQNHFRSCCHSD